MMTTVAAGNELREYVERFALALTSMGMQRMSARVLALFVCTDAPALTAHDIAEHLAVSPAAVSGAVRTLLQAGLLQRAPSPGSRRDHYRLADDTWTGAGVVKREHFDALAALAADGLTVIDLDGPAADRLREMRDFYGFLAAEIPALLDRWRSRRAGSAG
jgi:DNA-binding MarR family transcriptional regulator